MSHLLMNHELMQHFRVELVFFIEFLGVHEIQGFIMKKALFWVNQKLTFY